MQLDRRLLLVGRELDPDILHALGRLCAAPPGAVAGLEDPLALLRIERGAAGQATESQHAGQDPAGHRTGIHHRPLMNSESSSRQRDLAPGRSAVVALVAAFGGFHVAQQGVHLARAQGGGWRAPRRGRPSSASSSSRARSTTWLASCCARSASTERASATGSASASAAGRERTARVCDDSGATSRPSACSVAACSSAAACLGQRRRERGRDQQRLRLQVCIAELAFQRS